MHLTLKRRGRRSTNDHCSAKGLRQFLDPEQQRVWLEGEANPADGDTPGAVPRTALQIRRPLREAPPPPAGTGRGRHPQTYAATCLPIPRTTERFYWSVSCLPSSPDRPLARVNASWMELFALLPTETPSRARFILHLSDFTADGSTEPDHLDTALLESCVGRPEDLSHFFWKADTFGVKVRSAASIRAFLAHPHGSAPSAASTSPT